MPLRALFSALDAGATVIARAPLARAISAMELDALRDARIVKPAAAARAWPCDEPRRRCGREVMDAPPGSATPFVAVCEGSCEGEERCEAVDVSADDLAQVKLDRRELARVLRGLYDVDGPAATFAGDGPLAGEPVRLGEERSEAGTREVFVALGVPRARLAPFLEARERATRATLVLVPLARGTAPEWATRYAPGAQVEIDVLEDSIVARDGKLVRGGKPRLVVGASRAQPAAPLADAGTGHDVNDPGPVRPGGIAAQLGARQFADITMKVIDGHTIRVSANGRRMHATFIDLGLATRSRNPRVEWKVLLAACAGHGTFRWKNHGDFDTVKVYVSRLQKCLREAFGLKDNPFEAAHSAEGWRAKFFASSEIVDED